MSKKLKWTATIVALVLLGLLFLFKGTQWASAIGKKHIMIQIEGVKQKEVIELDTDCETLAEVMETHEELDAEITEGPYGAYLITLANETQDEAKGPWWIYESSNNEVCVATGYCPALDQIVIQDNDEFTFRLTSDIQ